MRVISTFVIFMTLLVSQQALSAACPASNSSTATGAADGSNCTVTGTASTIQLNFITGFSSTSSQTAVGDNNGTTLGAQRKLSFIKAAEILADQVSSSQAILMDASFSALSCNTNSATLGSAGATTSISHPAAPAGLASNTWYPVGLYNDISNSDQLSAADDIAGGFSGNGTGSDIVANFNSNIGQAGCLQNSDGWYYGFDTSPINAIGFTTVLLHEATHGFGFASLASASTGAKANGLDDIFSNQLYSKSDSSAWSVAGGLSNAQRAASAISSTGLLWNGSNVNAQAVGLLTAGYHDADSSNAFTSGDRVQMYAPNPVEGGSSVSHFDTAASPNEIMEPQYTAGQLDLGLALYLLQDIGWTVIPAVVGNPPVPSTTIEVGGSAHNDGDAFDLSDSNVQINVNNGTGEYSYSLDYNSTDTSSLISSNATGLTIGLPVSGEFAGDYTLTITDNGDGDVITLTVTRPLRLNWSTKALLNGDTSQTLAVEGGAVGSIYTFIQSGSADLIFRDENAASITATTAANNADSFNAALVHLDSLTVADISSMDVTVLSSYDDVVESDVSVYPSSLHSFTVKNSVDDILVAAVAVLNGNETLLTELNLLTSYSADVNGEFSVLLPNTFVLLAETSYAMSVSAASYISEELVLNSDNTDHNVVLIKAANGITLNGEINTQGSQNLLQKAPVVTIKYEDDTTELITVSVTSSTQASFSHEVDLNVKSLNLLTISQPESVTFEWDVSNVTQSQSISIVLVNTTNTVVEPVNTGGGGSGGGSLTWFTLLLLAVLLFRLLFLQIVILAKRED
jgi:hypothetical protein